jgi:hypothetical protein
MSERRRIYRDRDGVRRTMIWDDEDPDNFVVKTEQDVEPIIEGIKRDREIMLNDGDMKHLGRVPVAVAERAMLQRWDESDWAKWWNGQGPDDLPNGRAFRIWKPGGWV